ncbi:PfkB family carbohydrate kinase [Flavonifractor plautii]|nr:PfkB family carbohydrate kinase [Flavonifractor plautii]
MFSLKKILVVGSANVDFVIGVRQAPELGETILCRSFRKTCGGKGANQAYACGRLGGDTAFLNAVGDDPWAVSWCEICNRPMWTPAQ